MIDVFALDIILSVNCIFPIIFLIQGAYIFLGIQFCAVSAYKNILSSYKSILGL